MNFVKIMIVDDNSDFLDELKEILLAKNYYPISINDSSKVVELARNLKPDLILLDIIMKGPSGFQITRELKKFPETACIPVIAMSAYFGKMSDVDLAKLYDIQMLVNKPFNPELMIQNINNVLTINQ